MTHGIHRPRSLVRSLLVLVLLALVLAPSAALARQDTPAAGGGTLTGAFDVGPGGCPECFNPLQATAGFT